MIVIGLMLETKLNTNPPKASGCVPNMRDRAQLVVTTHLHSPVEEGKAGITISKVLSRNFPYVAKYLLQ